MARLWRCAVCRCDWFEDGSGPAMEATMFETSASVSPVRQCTETRARCRHRTSTRSSWLCSVAVIVNVFFPGSQPCTASAVWGEQKSTSASVSVECCQGPCPTMQKE
eukprot:365307-Chlamydomonas_euryale.AAC.11